LGDSGRATQLKRPPVFSAQNSGQGFSAVLASVRKAALCAKMRESNLLSANGEFFSIFGLEPFKQTGQYLVIGLFHNLIKIARQLAGGVCSQERGEQKSFLG
jgi:hypothetical protein